MENSDSTKKMFGIKDMYEKSVSNKEKYVWNKTHVWKKVFQMRKNMFVIKHMYGKKCFK